MPCSRIKPTDAQRLDWLERQPGIALLSDDNRHWAAVTSGMQNVPRGRKAQDIETTFFVKAKEWRGSVRRAIDVAMRADAEEE